MSAPCGRTGSHRHRVAWTTPSGRPDALVDRCNSGLLWSTVARAVVRDAALSLDGAPFTAWTQEEAWAYLQNQPPKWRAGLVPPTGQGRG